MTRARRFESASPAGLGLLFALACARSAPEPSPVVLLHTSAAAPSAQGPAPRCLAPQTPLVSLTPGTGADAFPSERCLSQARELLAKMTLEEKLGQMMQPERDKLTNRPDAQRFGFGSVLSGGGSNPT